MDRVLMLGIVGLDSTKKSVKWAISCKISG